MAMTDVATLSEPEIQVVGHKTTQQPTQPAVEESNPVASAKTQRSKRVPDLQPHLDQAIAHLSPVSLIQDGEQWSIHFEGMVLPARLTPGRGQQILSRWAEASEEKQWLMTGYPRTDEAGQVQLEVKSLKPPEEGVVNWVRLQGQVKGRDEATGRLFLHLSRNRRDREGNRPAWIMTVQGSVAKPGRYQLICTIEEERLALVDGALLPDRQRRSAAFRKQDPSPSPTDPSKDAAIEVG
jgi:hypothetical protein